MKIRENKQTLYRTTAELWHRQYREATGKIIYSKSINKYLSIVEYGRLAKAMKNTAIVLMAALGLTMSAQAKIGDTKGQSDARYGKPEIRHENGWDFRVYVRGNWNLCEGFNTKGYCVYTSYSHVDGTNLSDSEIQNLLDKNQPDSSHLWRAYNGSEQYATWSDGDQFYAMYYFEYQNYVDGRTRTVPCLRISNRATLIAMGLLVDPKASNANIDDAI